MKTIFAFMLLCVYNSSAQEKGRIQIKADELASDVLTPEKIYQYPKFTHGKILFKDQTSTEASLNYNYLNGEIEFVDQKNDTLAIAKHQMLNILRVEISKDTFYYDNGYLQQVLQVPNCRLAKREMLIILKKDKLGAYNQSTSTTGVEVLTTFRDYFGSDNAATLRIHENITLGYRSRFFFGNIYNSFLPASRKNLLKVFHPEKEKIAAYLQENEINYNSFEDLKKLFAFLK